MILVKQSLKSFNLLQMTTMRLILNHSLSLSKNTRLLLLKLKHKLYINSSVQTEVKESNSQCSNSISNGEYQKVTLKLKGWEEFEVGWLFRATVLNRHFQKSLVSENLSQNMISLNAFQNLKELSFQRLSLNAFSNILIKIEMEGLI